MNTKPYRQAIMAIILKEDNTFLIGSSPRDGGYKFPQGGLNEGEEKKAGLVREIFEELGTLLLESDKIYLIPGSFRYAYPEAKPYSQKYTGQELHVFVVKYRESMTFIPQDNEFDQLHWISKNEMDQFDFTHRKNAYYEAINIAITAHI